MFSFAQSFNWKDSKGHLFLLSKFILAQEPKYFYNNEFWERILNEAPQKAINRFINEKMLVYTGLDFLVSYQYKVTELKDKLRQRGLSISGNKDELVKRIIQADKEGMEKSIAGTEFLVCTQSGREIAEQYKNLEEEKRNKVEQQVIDYLNKRMFNEANLAVASYKEAQPESSGLGNNWKRPSVEYETEVLKLIFDNKPEILSKLDDNKLEPLRMGAAMMELWGESRANKWLPTDFETGLSMDKETAARMLIYNVINMTNLKQFKESGIKYIEVLGAPNSCQFCKEIVRKRYAINEAPTLPNPDCTHELGCRCIYLACID